MKLKGVKSLERREMTSKYFGFVEMVKAYLWAAAAVLILGWLLSPNCALAAGSCVPSSALFNAAGLTNPPADIGGAQINPQGTVKRVTYLCTAATGAATLSADIEMGSVNGWGLYSIMTKPVSGSAPTTDSDLAIASNSGLSIIWADGNGANIIDDNDTRWQRPDDPDGNGTAVVFPWLDDVWTVTMTNNSVNDAKFNLVLTLIKNIFIGL